MKNLLFAFVSAALLLGGFSSTRAQEVDPNHTVVRFDFYSSGAKYGHIDIELFDQEKPETVKNFLLYVYSGVYSNLVVHRMIPNFVLQAGRVRVADPASTAAFSTYIPGVNWGRITNEYSAGPELSNDYGTIAMARVPGDTNSASAEFFINLTNNLHLNTNDGGFTVFGRVVNSTGDRAGTNLMNHFNTFSAFNGISFAFIFDYFESFTDLPVSVDRPSPIIADLFTIQAYVIQGATVRDHSAPTVSIAAPAEGGRTTNGTVAFAGTATDNQEVARVLADTPLGRIVLDGKSDWAKELTLTPGTNRITVRSLDYFGNLSPGVEREIFYSVPRMISLETIGKGKVTGITDGQVVELGVTYPVSAKPNRGWYFNGWRGGLHSDARDASFTPQEGATNVSVRFSRTLLGLATGKYEGFFSPSSNGLANSSGMISLSLRPNGYYTGRLKPFGANYLIRGQFNALGQTVIVGPLGTNLLVLYMNLAGEGSDALTGTYSDGHFLSTFTLWRVQPIVRTDVSPYAGQYTFNLSPPRATNNEAVDGSGFGTLSVDTFGRIKLSGVLGNEAEIKQSASMLKDGRWLFHFTKKRGDFIGGLGRFDTNGTFAGDLRWFSPVFDGVETNDNVRLLGSKYTPPSQTRLFDWTNGVITLFGNGLEEPLSADVVLHEDGSFEFGSNTNNIQISVDDATGLMNGSFTHPVSNVTVPLHGAVLQSSNRAAGFFPGTGGRYGGFEVRRTE